MYNTDLHKRQGFLDLLLQWLGLDRETAPTLLVVLGVVPLIALVIVVTEGNMMAAFAPVVLLTFVALTCYRIDYSLFVLVALVLLFDQFHIPGFYPITFTIDYFRNLKEISYLPTISAGVVNPIEIHFVFILFVWMLVLSIKKQFKFNGVALWGSFGLFLAWVLFAFVHGLQTGGDLLNSLWEVRALFYFALFYMTIPQIIISRRQLNILVWIFILAISVKAFQGLARFATLGFSFGGRPTLTNHEDPVFMNTLFILLLGMLFFKAKNSQRQGLLLLLLPLLAGFFLAQRRAAIASLMVSLAAFFFLLPGKKQWKFLKIAAPLLVLVLIYGAAFWNSNSSLAMPVQMVKSGIYTSKEDLSQEDYYSNLYRDYENYNLAYTVRQYPVIGTGYGKKYSQPLKLANINFSLRDYIQHNQILWVIVKTGTLGFFIFWFFFNSFAFQGAYLLQHLNDPYLKAICIMIVVAVINQMVVSFYDLQLTYYRNMIYLGTLMGLLPVIRELDLNKVNQPKH